MGTYAHWTDVKFVIKSLDSIGVATAKHQTWYCEQK